MRGLMKLNAFEIFLLKRRLKFELTFWSAEELEGDTLADLVSSVLGEFEIDQSWMHSV